MKAFLLVCCSNSSTTLRQGSGLGAVYLPNGFTVRVLRDIRCLTKDRMSREKVSLFIDYSDWQATMLHLSRLKVRVLFAIVFEYTNTNFRELMNRPEQCCFKILTIRELHINFSSTFVPSKQANLKITKPELKNTK